MSGFIEKTQSLGIWAFIGILGSMWLVFTWASKPGDYPELRQGIRVVRHISSPRQLARSSFWAMRSDENDLSPSKFVSWMFSPMGSAEWIPPSPLEFSQEELKMISKIQPLLPAEVSIVPRKPDMKLGKQVVVFPDDARWVLIVKAYVTPGDEPVIVKELAFPHVTSS